MKKKFLVISSLGIAIVLLASLFLPAEPASSGAAVWSAETIPGTANNFLGPPGIDILDFEVANDGVTIYATPGDSISDNAVYKSINTGVSWAVINLTFRADLVAIAPDNKNIVAIARKNTPTIYVTTNGGLSWENLGNPQESGGDAASVIRDIAVSETREGIRYIAAAGTDAAGDANVWYFNIGASSPAWNETNNLTGFGGGDEAAALAFSPNFPLDATLVAITETDNASVMLQVLNISTELWNNNANYLDFPCAVVSNSGITDLTAASLSLAPNYLGTDDDRRRVFIGLTVNGNASAIATSGIYRFNDTTRTALYTNIKINSVAFNGTYLVAGSYDTNTVYRSSNPTITTPTFLQSPTTKGPGGESKVVIAWINNNVFAGTSGNESAFAISVDNGSTFNDISLIDTEITNPGDVAVSADGSRVYLVTDDGNDLSLWRMSSSWKRVFSQRGTTNYIVRIAPQSADVIYLAKKGSTTIYYNSGGGLTQWLTRTCIINVQDMAVESASILYVLNSAGSVTRSINAGSGWAVTVATSLASGATIVSVSTDTLLAGSQDGYVAYSTNGNSTWTRITPILDTGAGKVQVIADANYAANRFIYAASDTAGQNIKRWQIGTSTVWTDILDHTFSGGIYGLAINSGKIYALEYNGATAQSTLWIHISPSTASPASTDWSYSTTTTTTDTNDATVSLNATPQALKASTGKLWAVKTNGTNKLYSFSDTTIQITLLTPASGFSSHVNTLSGIAYGISFTWERPSVATEYELEMAMDEDFNIHVTTITVATANPTVSVIIGPDQTGNNTANFMPGVTYYWRIRTTKPIYSTHSESRYFYIEPLTAVVPGILTPASGRTEISRKPSFSWAPLSGATEYQFVLSANITMDKPIIDVTANTTGFTVTRELDYGGTYFWQIRATKPVETDWSPLANFTVEKEPAEPVPPVTVKALEPPVIELPAPPPQNIITREPPPKPPAPTAPDYLRGAIIVASVLLLIVIFLIILPLPAKFFPSPASIDVPLKGTTRRARNLGNKMGLLWEDLASRVRDLMPSGVHAGAPAQAGESDSISFAVKSFLLLTTYADKDSGQRMLSAEEEQALGKKLASGIRAIAGEKPLYLQFPEDAALFLEIWSRYGPRNETNRYLTKSFRSKPENAIALLKCYLAGTVAPESGSTEKKEFTLARYGALAKVVDPDKVYTAIAKLYKFKMENVEDMAQGDPTDSVIAYRFIRIHHYVKSKPEKPGTATG
ncbi:MAG TPA: hypothetical protein VMW86_10220 [Dehalococcoidales bacterium]|nr:hypothetical protein [Dehalococcoidales bacterium]